MFITIATIQYEGEEVLGVFETREEAEYARTHMDSRFDWARVYEFEVGKVYVCGIEHAAIN